MSHISISNIGPVNHVDIELNRFNVFIGPQSSGKSTIAKIISFCNWIEKGCILRGSTKHIGNEYLQINLIDYFNMDGYFRDDSSFEFSDDVVRISCRYPILSVDLIISEIPDRVPKNAYIPAERNVVAVPGIFSTKMPDNYLREFLNEWLLVREKYSSDGSFAIMNLDSYYFDKDGKADMLKLKNGESIRLSQASSGLQSVTPLCVYVDYLTSWIFSHEQDMSAEEQKLQRDRFMRKSVESFFENIQDRKELINEISNWSAEDASEKFSEINRSINENHLEMSQLKGVDRWIFHLAKRIYDLDHNFMPPSRANLVIEEPEQNLFPLSQLELLYFILSKINHNRDTIVMTTHSPYILYALNNCMLASLADGDIDEFSGFINIEKNTVVLPNDVSVWELRDGQIDAGKTIQDETGLIRSNYFDRVMQSVMADFHNLLSISNLKNQEK